MNRLLGIEGSALENGGQESGSPIVDACLRDTAWIGDGNNMANSWLNAAYRLGFSLRLACPEGYDPEPELLARAQCEADVVLTRDRSEAVQGADVVTTDVWASMGQEEETTKRLKLFAPFQVNRALLDLAAEDVLFMHCLPAHRGEEVSGELLDGEDSVVWDEAENRMHSQKALLEYLLEQ